MPTPNLGIEELEQGQARPDVTVNQAFLVIDAQAAQFDFGPLGNRPAASLDTQYYVSTTAPVTLYGPDGNGGWVSLMESGSGGGGGGDHGHTGPADGGTLATPIVSQYLRMLKQGGTPSGTPASGYLWVYPKSDGLFYTKNEAGSESPLVGAGGSGHTIMDEGSALSARANLDFTGAGVAVTDNAGAGKTVVTIPGPGTAGHVVQEEGSALTQRAGLNFTGAGVTATDDSGNNRTNVTIPDWAPKDAEYIVAAANGSLSAEKVLGTDINRRGLLAARGSAGAFPSGSTYLATDDNGGTLYQTNGVSWAPCGAAVNVGSTGTGHTIQDEGVSLSQRANLDFVGAGVTATDDAGNNKTIVTIPGSGTGGHTIQDEGTPQTQRANLNFVGAGVAVTDDSGNNRTVVTVTQPTAGHVIQDEGSGLTQRANLNFVGGGVTATDDAGNNRTVVTIPTPPTAGHTIQEEGSSLTHRANLNFIGAGVTAADDAANNRTNVTISTSSGWNRDAVDAELYPTTLGDKLGNGQADSAFIAWLAAKVLQIAGKLAVTGDGALNQPIADFGSSTAGQANETWIRNAAGTFVQAIVGAADQQLTGTINGDAVLRTSNGNLHIGKDGATPYYARCLSGEWDFRKVRINAGAAVFGHLSATAVWDVPLMLPGEAQDVDVTVTGAAVGDVCAASVNIALPRGLVMYQPNVISANTVRVTLHNWDSNTAGINPDPLTVRVAVWKYS
jgi:hypothetical protein